MFVLQEYRKKWDIAENGHACEENDTYKVKEVAFSTRLAQPNLMVRYLHEVCQLVGPEVVIWSRGMLAQQCQEHRVGM